MTENLTQIWKNYRGEIIKHGDTVLDLGSSDGYFSEYATNKGAKVYSMDVRNNFAVGPNNGFCEVKGAGFGTFIIPNQGDTPMRSLESLINDFDNGVDFLKCDIEGGEYKIFNCDLSKVKFIAIEFHVWTVEGEPVIEGLGVKKDKMPNNAVENLIDFLGKTHIVEIVGDKAAGGYIYASRQNDTI